MMWENISLPWSSISLILLHYFDLKGFLLLRADKRRPNGEDVEQGCALDAKF